MLFSAIALVAFTATSMAGEIKPAEKKNIDIKENIDILTMIKKMDCEDLYHSKYFELSQYLYDWIAEQIADKIYDACKDTEDGVLGN